MSQRSSQIARWGLLITTIALGVALVGMGLVGYFGARETSESVVRARGVDLSLSVRRALALAQGEHQTALDEVVEEMAEQGLRYAAVVTPARGVIAEAGESAADLPDFSSQSQQRGMEPQITWVGEDRVRVGTTTRPHPGPRGWAAKGQGKGGG